MARHRCHIPGCESEVQRRLLMCREHWAQVPRRLQDGVKKHFNPKQLRGERPSIEWLTYARWAINSVTGIGVQWPEKVYKSCL